MAAIVPDEGEIANLTDLIGTGSDWQLCLITTDITPDEANTASAWIAKEATGGWYARKTLTRTISGSTWSTPASVTPPSGVSSETLVAGSTYNVGTPQTWTYSGSGDTIYGYFILDAGGKLRACERLGTTQPVVAGNLINVTPSYYSA